MIKINTIELQNFRCFTKNNYSFGDKINILVGDNAVGKTSIVEAIALLSTCRSFRTSSDRDMIKNDAPNYYVEYYIEKEELKDKVSIAFDGKTRKIVVNGKQMKSSSDFVGKYKVITFSPNDIRLVIGEPKIRRKFLDTNISIFDCQYFNNLLVYNKILKERNEILKKDKEEIDRTLLKIYTDKLIECGKIIIEGRNKFINNINNLINEKTNILSNYSDNCDIKYIPNTLVSSYEKDMINSIEKDIILKTTTVGVHRDDFIININGDLAHTHGSQGQIKTIALSIKLCCVDIIRKVTEDIFIVLDDVFGELDENRQNQILKLLINDKQMFITTTSINGIDKKILDNSNILNINNIGR